MPNTTTPRKRAEKPKAPVDPTLASLTDEQKAAVMKAIINYPEGCVDGKARFAKKYGLPIPPPMAIISVPLKVEVKKSDLTSARYGGKQLSQTAKKTVLADLAEKLGAIGFTFDQDAVTIGVSDPDMDN